MVGCWTLSLRLHADGRNSEICGLNYIFDSEPIGGLDLKFDQMNTKITYTQQQLEEELARLLSKLAMRDNDDTSAVEREDDVELEDPKYSANHPRPVYQPDVQIQIQPSRSGEQAGEADIRSIASRSRLFRIHFDLEMGSKKNYTFDESSEHYTLDVQDVPLLERYFGMHETEIFRKVDVVLYRELRDEILEELNSLCEALLEAKTLVRSIEGDCSGDQTYLIGRLEQVSEELQHLQYGLQILKDWHDYSKLSL